MTNRTTLYLLHGEKGFNVKREELGMTINFVFGDIAYYFTNFAAYPIDALIADCGGTLGLFVGFNFLMFFDAFKHFIACFRNKLLLA